jgi:hypothetical protein
MHFRTVKVLYILHKAIRKPLEESLWIGSLKKPIQLTESPYGTQIYLA